jgi:hypothetical protein
MLFDFGSISHIQGCAGVSSQYLCCFSPSFLGRVLFGRFIYRLATWVCLLQQCLSWDQNSRLCLVLKKTNKLQETAVTVAEVLLLLEACTYSMRLCGLLYFPSLSLPLCVPTTDASRVQLPIKRCSEPQTSHPSNLICYGANGGRPVSVRRSP